MLSDQAIVPQVVKFIRQYKTKQGINNALNKEFKDLSIIHISEPTRPY